MPNSPSEVGHVEYSSFFKYHFQNSNLPIVHFLIIYFRVVYWWFVCFQTGVFQLSFSNCRIFKYSTCIGL